MKKIFIYLLFFSAFTLTAQESYFTIYNFTVEPQETETVYKLINDYYSANKSEGVTVSLWENHFRDSGNNHTHSLVFSGSFDAIGNMYSGGDNESWNLFITKLNQHIKVVISTGMGTTIASFGDTSTSHPVQKYFLIHAEDEKTFDEAYKALNSKTNPDGRINMMGNITAGQSPDGENRWAINGFKDFKAAIGGESKLMSDQERATRDKEWEKFIATNGGAKLIRSGLRVLLGQW